MDPALLEVFESLNDAVQKGAAAVESYEAENAELKAKLAAANAAAPTLHSPISQEKASEWAELMLENGLIDPSQTGKDKLAAIILNNPAGLIDRLISLHTPFRLEGRAIGKEAKTPTRKLVDHDGWLGSLSPEHRGNFGVTR